MANRYLAPNPPMFSLTPWMTPWPRLKTRPGDKYGISLLTSFLGGVLAPLSPCGALLLPAFFASVIGQRMRLVLHGGVFYLGLVITLVPLGLGLGAVGNLLTQYRNALIIVTSVILMLLGLAQAAGFGFDLSKAFPGAGSLQQRAHQK